MPAGTSAGRGTAVMDAERLVAMIWRRSAGIALRFAPGKAGLRGVVVVGQRISTTRLARRNWTFQPDHAGSSQLFGSLLRRPATCSAVTVRRRTS